MRKNQHPDKYKYHDSRYYDECLFGRASHWRDYTSVWQHIKYDADMTWLKKKARQNHGWRGGARGGTGRSALGTAPWVTGVGCARATNKWYSLWTTLHLKRNRSTHLLTCLLDVLYILRHWRLNLLKYIHICMAFIVSPVSKRTPLRMINLLFTRVCNISIGLNIVLQNAYICA